MSEKKVAMPYLQYLHIAFGLFMMFGFGRVFPAIGPLTEVGMQVLGLFIGVVWLWCFVGLLWPSLVALIALGATDFATFTQVVSMSFGNNITILLLFSMILFGSPQHVGVTKYITRWFLTRKIINGRPNVFNFIFLFSTYVLSTAVVVLPAIIMMWAILYAVLKEVGYKPGEKYSTIMVIGVFFAAISGQAAFPFMGSALGIVGVYESVSGLTMPFAPYILFGFIMSTLGIIVYTLLVKFVFRPDMSKIADVNTEMFEKDPLPPMNKLQKANMFFMVAFIVVVLLPGLLPSQWAVTQFLGNLGPWGIGIMLVAAMCVLRTDGSPLANFKEIASKYINWEVFLLVAAAMAVSTALTAPVTGITDMMMQAFNPVLGGHTALTFFVVMLLISIFLTSFANTMIMGMMLMPILVSFGVEAGVNLPAAAAAMILLLHYAIILPAASPFAAMLWGNKDWLTPKDIFKYASAIVVFATILFLVIGISLSNAIFSLFGYN